MAEEKHIDEGWKIRARAEKEKFSQSAASKEPLGEDAELPEGPGFIQFISTLATQALMALGQVEHPVTKQTEIDLDQARYLIDILEMLKQKTKGNLLPEEAKGIETLLYNLKMAYVRVSKTAKA